MAIVQDFLLTTFSRTPFVKPSDAVRGMTAMPRAIVNFNILDGVISAKPVGDTQELIVSLLLPREFAYRMVDMTAQLFQNRSEDWIPLAYLEITNAVRSLEAGSTQRHVAPLDQGLFAVPTAPIISFWSAGGADHRLPTYVMQALGGIAPVFTFKAHNRTATVATAGTFDCLFTFLEYDIEQAERFPVHWPAMVYTRT